MIQIISFLIAGICFGIFTGLIPGIHINLISLLVLSLSNLFLEIVDPVTLSVFIISMAITHTFLDSIPSIYLGAPDEAHALSVLPGHRMLLKGEGHNAIKLTVIGSFFSLIICIALIPLLIRLVGFIYPIIKNIIGYLLIVIMGFMILKEKEKLKSFFMFTIAGTLGLIVLNFPNLSDPLFPLLSGLFGFSILLVSLKDNTKIPKQIDKKLKINKKDITKAVTGATSVGFLASFLPGFGSSQAAIIAVQFLKKMSENGFLVLIGGINTVNMTLSLVTLYSINKARNGAVIVVSKLIGELTGNILLLYIAVALITGSIAVFLTLRISKIFSKIIIKVNYKVLVIGILSFITLLTFYFSGWIGLLVLATSTSIGLIASLYGIGKNHLMGCLIIPVILYFIL
jgi:putative membrane protein